jgi:hypothetical protein
VPPVRADRPPWVSQGTISTYEAPHTAEPPPADQGSRPATPAPRVETSAAPVVHTTQPASTPSPSQSHPQPHPASAPKSNEHPRGESREDSTPKAERSRDRVER